MNRIMGLAFGILYLLSSSIFFHAQAMDIVVESNGSCSCAMSEHNENSGSDNNCFEKCFGTYDEVSSTSIDEKNITTNKYVFDLLSTKYQLNQVTVFDPSLYHQLIDSGGQEDNGFPHNYIKVTKRLE